MAQFLKAYTVKKVEGSSMKNFFGLYSGFIVDHLLQSKSMKLYYLGISIIKNLGYRAPEETAEIVA